MRVARWGFVALALAELAERPAAVRALLLPQGSAQTGCGVSHATAPRRWGCVSRSRRIALRIAGSVLAAIRFVASVRRLRHLHFAGAHPPALLAVEEGGLPCAQAMMRRGFFISTRLS